METELLKRITINPEICHGKPTIRNTRYLVESILEYLAGGDSTEDILKEFSDLEKEDILACLAFAAKLIHC
jgi:uncharacterized protein (DUF433 family)